MDDLSEDDSLAINIQRMNQITNNNGNNATLGTVPIANALPPASRNDVASNSTTTPGTIVDINAIDNLNDNARFVSNLENQLEFSDDLDEAIVAGNIIILYIIYNNS